MEDMEDNSQRLFGQLPPEITERIVGRLDRNEVAGTVRLVNKGAAAQFRGPEHTTIRLSQPVPPHAFAARWLARGATRRMTLWQRRQLLCLTATSGVVANLDTALQATGCALTYEVFHATAASGQLETCQWLLERGCPTSKQYGDSSGLLAAAAGGGHRHVCEWLLSLDLVWSSGGADAAAHGGHVGLMEWLRQWRPQLRVSLGAKEEQRALIEGAAHGCELPMLQRVWRDAVAEGLHDEAKLAALAAAAGSPTPDWAAKLEWLEAQGCRPEDSMMAAVAAASRPGADAVTRLTWLRHQGYPVWEGALHEVARKGNLEAVQYLLATLVQPPGHTASAAAQNAAGRGQLAALKALHAAGWPVNAPSVAVRAAHGGHLHVLAWLVEAFGEAAAVRPGAELFDTAAETGSVEMLAWLRSRGCEWGPGTFFRTSQSGCEAALEWLVEQGCPFPGESTASACYASACRNGDLATARCLARLGCPWGADGRAFQVALEAAEAPVAALRWLLEAGCPVDLAATRAELQERVEQQGASASVRPFRGRLSPIEALERLGQLV
ncbi:hypothetical protein GPECTOR_73g626 [Gonium pectorale]|uniref:Uncharacterized protein n=1 Tax=Gonium pectorale TaxID=33097 RepID=A0A150G3M6_GONPE|nr:hypothetical protein GPECTOR_73g626 [Gonium pectorale]|eukprot:KXZ44105.1 hypothetical protein GPECTOR_73g626 [Gonium pectorale]